MTTAEPVLTIAELVAAGLRLTLKIGRAFITYAPRADQLLSLEHTIEAFADKQPANDNNPQEDVSPPAAEPAVALTKNTAPEASMEKTHAMPGVQRILRREAFFDTKFGYLHGQPANAPSPFVGRSRLKTLHSEAPAPASIQLVTRPVLQDWQIHHPQPQHKNDTAA